MGDLIEGITSGITNNIPTSICTIIAIMVVFLIFFWAIIKILIREIGKTNEVAIESIRKSYESTLKNNADTIKQLLNKIN